ncbi:MAG: rod shape-determining protein MreD [Lachnospirales bacterium]
MKQIIYLFLVLIIFIIQTTFLNVISIVGIKPNILLLLVITIGFLKGENDGLFVGCLAGLLHDSYFATYIGGNIFLYGIIGFLVGYLCRDFFKGNVVTPLLVAAVATMFYGIGSFVLIILLRGFTNIGYYMFIRTIPEVIYNCLFMIIVYAIAFSINSRLETKVKHKRKVF